MSERIPPAPSANSQLLVRLIPQVGDALATWRADRHRERLEVLLGETFRNVDANHVVSAINSVPGFGDDLDIAVESATRSSSNEKIRLLGRVLRAELSAKDQAAVDNAQQILRVAVELEPVDVRALAAVANSPRRDPMETLRTELRVNEATGYAVRSRLLRLGLVEMGTEATLATPGSKDDDEVFIEESWGTTPVFTSVMMMLVDSGNV